MQYQDDNSNEIFTWKVKAGNRVYFMNVKKDKNERLYLVIKESKQGDEEGSTKEVHRIMIFEKDFDRFFYGMEQVSKFVNDQIIAGNLNQNNFNQNGNMPNHIQGNSQGYSVDAGHGAHNQSNFQQGGQQNGYVQNGYQQQGYQQNSEQNHQQPNYGQQSQYGQNQGQYYNSAPQNHNQEFVHQSAQNSAQNFANQAFSQIDGQISNLGSNDISGQVVGDVPSPNYTQQSFEQIQNPAPIQQASQPTYPAEPEQVPQPFGYVDGQQAETPSA